MSVYMWVMMSHDWLTLGLAACPSHGMPGLSPWAALSPAQAQGRSGQGGSQTPEPLPTGNSARPGWHPKGSCKAHPSAGRSDPRAGSLQRG